MGGMTETTEHALNVDQAAERFGVTPRTIRNWINRGDFPNAYRVGLTSKSAHMIPMSDIEAFDKKRRQRK